MIWILERLFWGGFGGDGSRRKMKRAKGEGAGVERGIELR